MMLAWMGEAFKAKRTCKALWERIEKLEQERDTLSQQVTRLDERCNTYINIIDQLSTNNHE